MRVSNGKVRPDLPRRSELGPVPAPSPERVTEGRDASGRFATGNGGARNRAWKTPIAKLLGRDVTDPIAARVAADAWHLFAATVRSLPSDGVLARSLVAQWAHHSALASYWAAQTFDRVLGTAASVEAEERARLHGQRSERLAVTLLSVSTQLAKGEPNKGTAAALKAATARLEASRAQPVVDDDEDDVGAKE